MELKEMRSLVALGECGSIRAAGERCSLSPAAIHKHLKKLESEFGVRLYEKRNEGLCLTDGGKVVLPFMREILSQHDAALTAMGECKDGKLGLVRVGAGPAFGARLLPKLLKEFRRRFPRVDVFVETGDTRHLIGRIRSGALDLIFALAAAALEDRNLEQVAVWECAAGFISGAPTSSTHSKLQALSTLPFILFPKGNRMEAIVQNYLDGLNFQPNVVMRSDSAEAIKAMIRSGLGISVLFLWNIDTHPSSGFSVIRTEAPPLLSRMALIRVKTNYTSKPVEEFIGLARRMRWKHLRPVNP
jgi:DNA-binding transcriptional LysR family regulator